MGGVDQEAQKSQCWGSAGQQRDEERTSSAEAPSVQSQAGTHTPGFSELSPIPSHAARVWDVGREIVGDESRKGEWLRLQSTVQCADFVF